MLVNESKRLSREHGLAGSEDPLLLLLELGVSQCTPFAETR